MIRAHSIRPGAPSRAASARTASALDEVPGAFAREVLERGSALTIGPQGVLDVGRCAAAVTWEGIAFRVYDQAYVWRGTYASCAAAHGALLDVALEWEMRIGETAEAVGI